MDAAASVAAALVTAAVTSPRLSVQATSPGTISPGTTSPGAGKHSPERSCVACRRRRPQGELVRLTRTGGVWAVQTGHRSGRGSYLCADTPGCWAEKRLKRAFGAQASALSLQLMQGQSVAGASVPQTREPTNTAPSRP